MKKKVFAALLSVLMLGMLAGCGEKSENTQTSSNAPSDSVADNGVTGNNDTITVPTYTEEEIMNMINAPAVYTKDIAVENYLTLTGDYKGLDLWFADMEETTEEEIMELLLAVYWNNMDTKGKVGITDRAAELGDTVNIDYVGKQFAADGSIIEFPGGTAAGQPLELGSGSYIDGFESGLVGVTPGTTLDLNLTFPENYGNTDLAGQDVIFTVTVNYIYPNEMADLEDAFVEEYTGGEFATAAEFRDYCEDYLRYTHTGEYNDAKYDAVAAALKEQFVVNEVPEELRNYCASLIYNQIAGNAMSYGMDADSYATYYGFGSAAEMAFYYGEDNAGLSMMLQYVANAENLTPNEEELEGFLTGLLDTYYWMNSVDEFYDFGDKEYWIDYAVSENAVNFVAENGNVNH